jgi:hypothetical protein
MSLLVHVEWKRQAGESLRDFGQALEDLYRRAYSETPDIVEENAIKAFLDKCGQSEDFRLAVKRTRCPWRSTGICNHTHRVLTILHFINGPISRFLPC